MTSTAVQVDPGEDCLSPAQRDQLTLEIERLTEEIHRLKGRQASRRQGKTQESN
jgi:hypothetical protein